MAWMAAAWLELALIPGRSFACCIFKSRDHRRMYFSCITAAMAPVHPAILIHAARRTGHLLFATVRIIPNEKKYTSLSRQGTFSESQ